MSDIIDLTTEKGYRECKVCGKKKPVEDFYIREDKLPSGKIKKSYRNECKECTKARMRLKTTGWSPEEYERAWCIQEGKCAICGCTLNSSRYTKASADHDHVTGKLRGILCNNCNTALGLMKDSPYRLESAIRYLESHGRHY